ncbi:hypothetical protein B0H16DRAFT_1880443, partial [Mycena metata]
MEPEDSEPYLNTSYLDATITTTDTKAAGPTPPPPLRTRNAVVALNHIHRHRKGIREAVVISAGHVAHPAAYLKHTMRDRIQGWPLVEANGCIFAVLPEGPLTAHLHWLHADPVGWNMARVGPSSTRTGISLPCSPVDLIPPPTPLPSPAHLTCSLCRQRLHD